MAKNSGDKGSPITRRSVLKGTAAAGAGAFVFGGGQAPWHFVRNAFAEDAIGNFPVKGNPVFGFNVPQTGPYSEEGADELRALKLAVKHINEGGGMLETMKPLALKGQGVLGKKVEYVTGDTATKPDAARASARRMIERDKVIMYTGSSSSAVAIAQQYLAQEKGVIYMVGLSHSNETTGKDRRRYGFRHFFNAYMTGEALGPVLSKAYGTERKAFHLTADYSWGHTQYASMKAFTEKQGWQTTRNIMTPLGTADYSQYLTAVLNSPADVLILNHYGKDMVNSLTQAVRFGMRDRKVGGKQMQIVVPLYSRLMAQGAGSQNIEGVYGSTNWMPDLTDPGSVAFTKAFEAEYKAPPSQAAQTCYVQTLVYANAVQTAGTFYPPAVIKGIEDLKLSGIGPGEVWYRPQDHQAFHTLYIVQGKGPKKMKDKYDLLERVSEVQAKDVIYDDQNEFFKGELGPYKPA